MTDTLDADEFEAGMLCTSEQLPENDMDPEGRPEWVDDGLLAVLSNGTMLEFQHAYECTAVYEIREEDGTVGEIISGTPR